MQKGVTKNKFSRKFCETKLDCKPKAYLKSCKRSAALTSRGNFGREHFYINYFKIYFLKQVLVQIFLCKILLQNFVEIFLDYLPIAYVKCLLWKIIHPLIDL